VYVCMCVCVYVCMYVCVCVCVWCLTNVSVGLAPIIGSAFFIVSSTPKKSASYMYTHTHTHTNTNTHTWNGLATITGEMPR
jgi:hypothetical protein